MSERALILNAIGDTLDELSIEGVTRATDAVEAAISARLLAQWQPIETAPKDGTLIDVWAHGRRYPAVRWTYWVNEPKYQIWENQHLYDADGGHHWDAPHINPTHWMLPPQPPIASPQDT